MVDIAAIGLGRTAPPPAPAATLRRAQTSGRCRTLRVKLGIGDTGWGGEAAWGICLHQYQAGLLVGLGMAERGCWSVLIPQSCQRMHTGKR